MTRRLTNIGREDTVTEIDTNADGKPDVRVITDAGPQDETMVDDPVAPPLGDGPQSASIFDTLAHWVEGYRSMADDPHHPLHHLANA